MPKLPLIWCIDKLVWILGVHLKKDYEQTKYFNIEACIQQMEQCAKTQSQRKTSLKGKTIVRNTLIL